MSKAGPIDDDSPLIRAQDVSVRYSGTTVALDHLTVDVPGSGITCLLGANGAGKTTFMEAASGLRPVTSGAMQVLGATPGCVTNRNRVGVMLQDGGLPGSARPRDFLRYVARLYPEPLSVDDVIERVGLTEISRTPIRRLSGGEAKRVAWAAALLSNPKAMILDEPTAALDPVVRSRMHAGLREQSASGVPMVIATHLIEDVESLADYIVVLKAGRIAVQGTPDELRPRNRIEFRAHSHLPTRSLLDALPGGATCHEIAPGRYRVHVPGDVDPGVVATASSWCTQHGGTPDVSIADLSSVLFEAIGGVNS